MIENKELLDGDVDSATPDESPVTVENTDTETDTGSEEIPVADADDVSDAPDYDEIARADLIELKRSFPELRNISDITELQNPIRYAALRDLGLTAEEAYLATSRRRGSYDNRAHLTPSIPGSASVGGEMSGADYDMARELFSELSDSEIRKLYRKVTK